VTVDPADPAADHAAEPVAELERAAAAAVNLLAARPDPEAFQALLRLSALIGESLGVSARTLATSGSWAKVAEVAGTTRQAAWSRWSS
jgi:hypothetical protein